MNLADVRSVEQLAEAQRGVFSHADLQVLFEEKHATAFHRRVNALERHGVLRRFVRGFYVASAFDLATLSQRIAPESYVSFGSVLAKHLLVGPTTDRRVMAVKLGRTKTYRAHDHAIVHVGITPKLFFGFETRGGVRFADREKAVLDVLYFHLRGRKYPFDPFSDIGFEALDDERVREYLARYANPKFVKFAETTIGQPRDSTAGDGTLVDASR